MKFCFIQFRKNDVQLNSDSEKCRSALWSFANSTIRPYDDSVKSISAIFFRQNNDSAKLHLGKTTTLWNDVSGKWCDPITDSYTEYNSFEFLHRLIILDIKLVQEIVSILMPKPKLNNLESRIQIRLVARLHTVNTTRIYCPPVHIHRVLVPALYSACDKPTSVEDPEARTSIWASLHWGIVWSSMY